MDIAIQSVGFKPLVTHTDARGFLREVLRVADEIFTTPFGQWTHSWMRAGVLKAWHLHRVQTDYWYVVGGVIRVGLWDCREESPTRGRTMDLLLGDGCPPGVLRIPPGVAHGCKVLRGPASLLYLTSHTYNPADELRIPADTPEAQFDWRRDPPLPAAP